MGGQVLEAIGYIAKKRTNSSKSNLRTFKIDLMCLRIDVM
jgi:hypothetical protein